MLFGDLDPDERYLYHYTSTSSLAKILDSGSLRFGPYGATNDPREAKAWLPSFSVENDRQVGHEEFNDLLFQADQHFRGTVHVGCFTTDRRDPEVGVGHHWRGFGRARMWDQYASKHEGACLIFDFDHLTEAVKAAVQGNRNQSIRSGEVRYIDEDPGLSELHLSIADIDDQGLDSVCRAYLDRHWRDLLFTKNSDWAAENEYRYALLGSDGMATFVPIRSALVAIVLGDAFPATESSVLPVRLDRLQCADQPAVAVCHWRNGAPQPLPFN